MPRLAVIAHFSNPWQFSFHLMNGQWWFQAFLFGMAFLAGLGLLFGVRTQSMCFVSWLLLTSLHNRNYAVLHGGDTLLRLLLFWAMFVPLNLTASIDSSLNIDESPKPKRLLSIPSTLLSLQAVILYVVSTAYKFRGEDWTSGLGVYYALSLNMFRTPFGEWIFQFPNLMQAINFAILYYEMLAPFFLFFPIFSDFIIKTKTKKRGVGAEAGDTGF
jgi:hypothetical protein